MANGHPNVFLAPLSTIAVDEAANDPVDLDAFLREQSELLVRFLYRRSRNEEDARDAAQESLTRFVHHYSHQPSVEWKAVLYRIAINVANDRLRQARSRFLDAHVPLEGIGVDELEDDQPNAEEAAVRAQEEALLTRAVLALPPKCQQVYLLRRVRGMTSGEVAEHCGISVRMVEKHLANALVHIYRSFGLPPMDGR